MSLTSIRKNIDHFVWNYLMREGGPYLTPSHDGDIETLREYFFALSDEQVSLIELRIEGVSAPEAAKRLNIPLKLHKRRMKKAVRTLKQAVIGFQVLAPARAWVNVQDKFESYLDSYVEVWSDQVNIRYGKKYVGLFSKSAEILRNAIHQSVIEGNDMQFYSCVESISNCRNSIDTLFQRMKVGEEIDFKSVVKLLGDNPLKADRVPAQKKPWLKKRGPKKKTQAKRGIPEIKTKQKKAKDSPTKKGSPKTEPPKKQQAYTEDDLPRAKVTTESESEPTRKEAEIINEQADQIRAENDAKEVERIESIKLKNNIREQERIKNIQDVNDAKEKKRIYNIKAKNDADERARLQRIIAKHDRKQQKREAEIVEDSLIKYYQKALSRPDLDINKKVSTSNAPPRVIYQLEPEDSGMILTYGNCSDYLSQKEVIKLLIIVERLTPREKDILKLIFQEYTSQEMSKELGISFNTVESHRKNLMNKIGCNTSVGAAKFAMYSGLAKEYLDCL